MKNFQEGSIAQRLSILAAFALLVASGMGDFFLLFSSDAAPGVDGYYYVLQTSRLILDVELYYFTYAPVVIYYFTALTFLFSDPVIAIKIGTLILQFLLSLGIFCFVVDLTRSVWLAVLGLAIVALSHLHFYYISEFLSNLGSLVFLIWGAFALVRFFEFKNRIWLIASFMLFVGAIFSHRSAFAVLLLVSTSSVVSIFLFSANKLVRVAAIGLFLIVLASPAIVLGQPVFELPDALKNEFLFYPRLPFRELNLQETVILIIALVAAAIAYQKRNVQENWETVIILVTVLIWSLFTTLNPFLNHRSGVQGVFGRLDTLAFVQAAVVAPLALKLLQSHPIFLRSIVTICFIGLLIWSFCKPLPYGLSAEYIQRRERLIKELPAIPKPSCPNPLVIARHGDQFLVTYFTGLSAQQKPSEDLSNQCVYWLIDWDISSRTFSDSRLLQNGGDFALVDNILLLELASNLPEPERLNLVEKNPHLKPLFETLSGR